MTSLSKFVCNSENDAQHAKGILIGQGYTIEIEPLHIDYGTTDMSNIGEGNHPYADKWIVIGKKA